MVDATPLTRVSKVGAALFEVMARTAVIGALNGDLVTTTCKVPFVENSNVPVIIDAGIGTPSEATLAMELGADGVLLNTAVAQSKNPCQMASAMN